MMTTTNAASGCFIEPDGSLEAMEDPNVLLKIPTYSGYQALRQVQPFLKKNRIFDHIAHQISQVRIPYEDQCSAKYYFDLIHRLRDMSGEYGRVVEVGCYMGGSATIIAGCIERFDFDFDIVDISAENLLFTYERIRRTFPEAIHRVRLFLGTLPQYVAAILHELNNDPIIIHHDGAHDFMQVTKDLSSLYYLGRRFHGLIIQDTHLRGRINECNFVDMAVYAVFGTDVEYIPLGTAYGEEDTAVVNPNQYQGNYFVPGVPEGIVVPMHCNSFKYPHPALTLESFL